MTPRVRLLAVCLVAIVLFVAYVTWSQRNIANLRDEVAQLQSEAETLGRMLEGSAPTVGQFPMPIIIGFDGCGTDLDPPSDIKLWTWDYPMLVGLFAEAFAGRGEPTGSPESVPFADPIPEGANYVWAEFQPPVLCRLVGALEADKLALWSAPNSDEVHLYVRTPAGRWYECPTSLSSGRLAQYRDTVYERDQDEP